MDIEEYKNRFTKKGKQVFEKALETSQHMGQCYLCVEHVIYSFFKIEPDLFKSILYELKINELLFETEIERSLHKVKYYTGKGFRIDEKTTNLFKSSLNLAKSNHFSAINSFDIFISLVESDLTLVEIFSKLCPSNNNQIKKIVLAEIQKNSFQINKNVYDIKELLMKSLESLPLSLKCVNSNSPEERLLYESKIDAQNLSDFWKSVEENASKCVIALVGMVNAGKSAVGNILLNKNESEVFTEGAIRETEQASVYEWNRDRILIDLPGLGSVNVDDDKVVENYLNRANVLLIVIDASYPIPNHLYQFLGSKVIKRRREQQIIILLNKCDIWDGIPDFHKQKQLERYIEFLTRGNKKLGFDGIEDLFDYKVPINTFSVKHIRNCSDTSYLNDLLLTLENSIFESRKANQVLPYIELKKYLDKYSIFQEIFDKQKEKLEIAENMIQLFAANIDEIISNNIDKIGEEIHLLKASFWNEMEALPGPSYFELIFETAGLQNKKDQLIQIRSRNEDMFRRLIVQYIRDFSSVLSNQLEISFGYITNFQTFDSLPLVTIMVEYAHFHWQLLYGLRFSNTTFVEREYEEKNSQILQKFFDKLVEQLDQIDWATIFNEIREEKFADLSDSTTALETFVDLFKEAKSKFHV